MDNNELQGELGWLYSDASAYRNSDNYRRFLNMYTKYRRLSGFNIALIYTQMPGATYYLTEQQWWQKHGRLVKTDERPLIALQPFAPVMLLYDYSQTKAGRLSFNPELEAFDDELEAVSADEAAKTDWKKYDNLIANLPNYGIDFSTMRTGQYYKGKLEIGSMADPEMTITWVEGGSRYSLQCPPAYTLKFGSSISKPETFSVLTHELGHFFLHHLPCTYQTKWENPRCGLPVETREFEAESVAWIVCRHMGVETKAREYLAGYMKDNKTIPPVDVLQIGRAVERIEALYKQPCEFKKSVFYKCNPHLQQRIEAVEKGQPSLF